MSPCSHFFLMSSASLCAIESIPSSGPGVGPSRNMSEINDRARQGMRPTLLDGPWCIYSQWNRVGPLVCEQGFVNAISGAHEVSAETIKWACQSVGRVLVGSIGWAFVFSVETIKVACQSLREVWSIPLARPLCSVPRPSSGPTRVQVSLGRCHRQGPCSQCQGHRVGQPEHG